MEHVHLPQRDNPDWCAYDSCGLIWSDPVHAPSVALRKLSEAAPDLRPLAHHERASGAPFVPSQRDAAPATHTGRPAMHPGSDDNDRWVMCPMRATVPGTHRQQCPFSSPILAEVGDHLARAHQYGDAAVGFYLANPWYANEDRKDWVARTAHLRGIHNIASKVQETDASDDYCEHPNGFGPNGCPCGASAPDEEETTFRNLTTGEDERATRCPDCPGVFPESRILRHFQAEHFENWPIDKAVQWAAEHGIATPSVNVAGDGSPLWGHQIECPVCDNAFIKGNIRRHLQVVHKWTGDEWDDWAESVNFMEHDLVPPVLAEAVNSVEPGLAEAIDRFLNTDVTMEQIMTDAQPETNGHKLDPHALEAALTAWWMDKAEEETRAVVPKAVEYGATDLRDIGRDLADCMGRTVTDEEATELGIFFYLRGKLSRWVDAVKRGDRPSDDTIYDIGVYCRMAQRNRDAGGWPGLPKD